MGASRAGYTKKNHGYANPYQAQIFVDGRSIHLGCFSTSELAHAAYLKANAKYFGEFSPVNSRRIK